MKNERLFDAIGQIDEELIEEADPNKKQEQKKKERGKINSIQKLPTDPSVGRFFISDLQ